MYQRIMIIGSPGAGKSTFAQLLARELQLPLIHLDKLNWIDDKETVSKEVFLERLDKAVVGSSWIIDGNYGSSMEVRLKRADLVIWLQVPRLVCLYRAVKRYLHSLFQKNSAGNPKSIDWDFIRFIWGFPKSHQKTEELLEQFSTVKVIKVTNSKDALHFFR
ncbi:topology modulation protein [Streptococcus hillyeri]|uniref:Topology modulation protein n=2 Tax=Streptococcus hillyeri TaxID=2282420 RepID=A0A3L9DTT3_9STRE|nr:topology modulation protein [Streptococcus hillyeri]